MAALALASPWRCHVQIEFAGFTPDPLIADLGHDLLLFHKHTGSVAPVAPVYMYSLCTYLLS
ncbi:uncharacterized protein P884DRAFT_264676 [Thermothelomyces heterothallicus CBS 202.75]|uniref:uncharacterized protein n=1 Tax=Thermothelomyces heterothallicus CBS 202.75 TaxID=1149848 RepID=UPI003742A5F3